MDPIPLKQHLYLQYMKRRRLEVIPRQLRDKTNLFYTNPPPRTKKQTHPYCLLNIVVFLNNASCSVQRAASKMLLLPTANPLDKTQREIFLSCECNIHLDTIT